MKLEGGGGSGAGGSGAANPDQYHMNQLHHV